MGGAEVHVGRGSGDRLASGDMERVPLLEGAPKKQQTRTVVVVERVWVLFMTSLMAFLQGGVWNTWGPIAPSVQTPFDWSDGEIALLANWGPICYFVAVLPSSWLMDCRGVKPAMIVVTLTVLIGSAVRIIPTSNNTQFTALVHLGQILNGLAGPIAMSIPPVVSSTFFPTSQRTLATAIMSVSNYLGVAVTFVAGPQIVNNSEHARHKVFVYLAAQTAVAAFCALGVLLYFPNKPIDAPSRSAAADRTLFWKGLHELVRLPSFWACAAAYGTITGMYSGWSAYLAPNLQNFYGKNAQDIAAWLGFYATLAGAVGGVGFGLIAESTGGRMKPPLIALCTLAALSYLWFTLVCGDFIDGLDKGTSDAMLYTSCIFGGLVLNGTIPLFYETSVENAYPIAEGSTTCLLTTFNNLGCLIFLLVPMIPNIGSAWANWSLVGSCFLSVVILIFYVERKKRTSYDLSTSPDAAMGVQ